MEAELQQPAEEAPAEVSPEQFIAEVVASDNLAAVLDDKHLSEIALQVFTDYNTDKESMAEWFERMERGLSLARLVKEDRNYPFKGAANVKYPLITSAALQFNARAYPAIVPADRVVKCKVWGADPQGQKAARADRISEFMSWQLSADIEEWEEETDKLLVQLPIVGTVVRKWWYDPVERRPRCRLVDPGKFIVNDKVKNLADAPRMSEELPLYPSEIVTRIRSGQFVEFEYQRDEEDEQAPQKFIEQHTRLDLDEDGYEEPYIVTVHEDTETVVRIVADFVETDVRYDTEMRPTVVTIPVPHPVTGQPIPIEQIQPQEVVTGILSIRRGSYFVAHQFLPSIDGGFHGTGLGLLLGDISDSINTIINMLLDAGHYASLGGGFIGSELRLKGGAQRHKPGEWKMVPETGGNVRNAVVPLTFPGPDATMFQMLGMLIEAGREISSVKDVTTGEAPNRQQTATATLALIEQGLMVFTAAYKRIFRALKKEYAILGGINRETLDPGVYNRFHDAAGPDGQPIMFDPAQDFGAEDMDIQPVADPRSVTKMQQAAKAQMIGEWAEKGFVDRGEAISRMAEAMDVEDVEALMPQPDPMQQQMAELQMHAARADVSGKMADIELTMAKVEEARANAMESIAGAETDRMKIMNEAKKDRLDGLFRLLEEDRARLEAVRAGLGGMAGASGNGSAQGGGGQGMPAPQGPALPTVFGGQGGI